MKLYKLFSYLSYRLRYESTYLELKYHLDQVLKNKKNSWVNCTMRFDRGIGKTVTLARLSAKYDIPVFVKNNSQKQLIERDIPKYLPKYFEKCKPKAIAVENNNLRGVRCEVGLVDEPMTLEDIKNIETYCCKKLVGYVTK